MPATPPVPLHGCTPEQPEGAVVVGAPARDDPIEVTVILREHPRNELVADSVSRLLKLPAAERRHLSYREFAELHSPADSDLTKIDDFAAAYGLSVGETDAVAGTVRLRGSAADIARAFSVDLATYREVSVDGSSLEYRSHTSAPAVPAWLAGVVDGVAGLSTRPFAKPHFLVGPEQIRPMTPGAPAPTPAAAREGYSAVAIAEAYGISRAASARGQTIGIIELGGGFEMSDIERYCQALGLPVPPITVVSVDGGRNAPTNGGDASTADGEVLLDMQVAAAAARGARQRIYFTPNTDQGFLDAVARAVKDGCTSISISWGAPERQWTASTMRAMDRICQAAMAMGIPVFAAAGDDGSTDGLRNGRSNADFPASSPHVIGCGGTELPKLDRRKETAWNDLTHGGGAGGGAPSDFWPVPDFQKNVTLPTSVNDGKTHRTVPDLAANAAPETGYRIMVGGKWFVFGGTSAVSPLMAAMAAVMTAKVQLKSPGRRLGDFLELLYGPFRSGGGVTQVHDGSSNGQYQAGAGDYNAVTGVGTPNFARMLSLTLEHLGLRKRQPQSPQPPRIDPGTPGELGLAS